MKDIDWLGFYFGMFIMGLISVFIFLLCIVYGGAWVMKEIEIFDLKDNKWKYVYVKDEVDDIPKIPQGR